MTLVVGVDLGYYALFAGDDRETVFDGENLEPRAVAGTQKVRATPLGLATGSGLTVMVFPAIEGLAEQPEILSDADETADFFRHFVRARSAALATQVTDPRVVEQVPQVGWLTSAIEDSELSVKRFHWSTEFEPEYMPTRTPASLLPTDLSAEISYPAELRLMKALRVCRGDRDLEGSFEHNLRMVVRYFKEQSALSHMLGSGLQVGYHTKDGDIEVLDIMQLDEVT